MPTTIGYTMYNRPTTNIFNQMCVLMQGLADTFIILGMAFDSPEAKQLNKDIFECIYFHALTTSSALAKVDGERPAQSPHCNKSTCCIWSTVRCIWATCTIWPLGSPPGYICSTLRCV